MKKFIYYIGKYFFCTKNLEGIDKKNLGFFWQRKSPGEMYKFCSFWFSFPVKKKKLNIWKEKLDDMPKILFSTTMTITITGQIFARVREVVLD